jgi:hypothetical protein
MGATGKGLGTSVCRWSVSPLEQRRLRSLRRGNEARRAGLSAARACYLTAARLTPARRFIHACVREGGMGGESWFEPRRGNARGEIPGRFILAPAFGSSPGGATQGAASDFPVTAPA